MRYRFLLLLAMLLSVVARAETAAAGGKALFAACVACHGAAATGNAALQAPALAGQDAAYLERQLRNFRAGVRGGDGAEVSAVQMRGMAMAIATDSDVAELAAWMASLPRPALSAAVAGDLREGNNLWQGKCAACHGVTGEGYPALNAPRLTGLDSAYLRRQFLAFREGRRGAHPADRYGRQMAMMAKTIDTGAELDAVLSWLRAQPPGAQ